MSKYLRITTLDGVCVAIDKDSVVTVRNALPTSDKAVTGIQVITGVEYLVGVPVAEVLVVLENGT